VNKEFELPYRDSTVKANIPGRNLSFVLDVKDVKSVEGERECI